MRKDLLSLVLTASLVCGMMPMTGAGQKASAADSGASGGIEAQTDTADASDNAKEGEETVVSGTFGGTKDPTGEVLTSDTHQWSLAKESGVLTISGEGEMPDYTTSTCKETPWYTYKDDIKKIVFTGNVSTVGTYAFYQFDKVTEVDFTAAEELDTINTSAFHYTSALSTLTGTDHIVNLGTSCFESSGLESVSMPNVETVPQKAFKYCKLTSISFANATLLSNEAFYYIKPLKEVNAPKVEILDGKVFGGTGIETIELPELTTIQGGYTFQNCSNLKEMNFPKLNSLKGQSIFEGCSSLEAIDLPQVTEATGVSSFASDCSKLMYANFPNATTSSMLGFQNCYSLVYVYIPGVTTLRSKKEFTNCTSLKRLYITGNNLTSNVDYDFYDGLKSIGLATKPEIYILQANKSKFNDARNYTNVTLQMMTDDDTFTAAKAKETDVRITQEDYDIASPKEPKVTGAASGAEITYRYYTDAKCQTPANSDDPTQKPTVPGQYYIRATAGAVTDVSFETLSNIVPFKIFGDITRDDYVYSYGKGLLTITDATVMDTEYTSVSDVPWYKWRTEIEKVVVKEGVTLTKIAPYAFSGMSELKYFDLPASVTSIGTSAFNGCSKWGSDSTQPAENVLTSSVTSIGESAFYNCSAITGTMTFNDTITKIPVKVLYGCAEVTQIKYSANVTAFGEDCFYGTGISEITLPAGITAYPNAFLRYCKKLTSVTVPQGVTALADNFFYNCESLTEVTLPQSLTTLSTFMLFGCESLTQFTIPESVTTIGNSCFRQTGLTSITIPETVNSLGTSVFYHCDSLENIELPATLTTLPNEVFSRTGIKKMIVPATVTNIGEQVFTNCSNLTYLEFLNDDYTADTFTLKSYSGNPPFDNTFAGFPEDAMIVCDGSTYDLLSQVDTVKKDSLNGWNPSIIHKRSALLEDLQTSYTSEKAEAAKLTQSDYDATLWSDFQAALQAADELFVVGDDTYEKIENMTAAIKSISAGGKIFLRDTWIKANATLESGDDYDTAGDGADAWYAFMDAADAGMTILMKEDASFADIIACDKKIKQASEQIVLLPTTTAKAAYDKTVADAKALTASNYTAESWAALQTALGEAEELMKTADRISLVKAAEKKVSDAVAALVEASGEEPGSNPSSDPGSNPSSNPSANPSTNPSANPSTDPSTSPSTKPSTNPGTDPSANPSTKPSTSPSTQPSTQPSVKPSTTPTQQPGETVTVKKVTLKKAKSSKKKTMLVQWKKLAGVTGYQVQIALKKNFKKGKKTYTVKKAKTVKKTIKKLKSKKKYFVRVRAYKTVKGKKYYGKWSKVKTVKVK